MTVVAVTVPDALVLGVQPTFSVVASRVQAGGAGWSSESPDRAGCVADHRRHTRATGARAGAR
ncbi:hypothetical protein V6V47_07370, partial [Micromonospora sp. CPCC 205539]|uniref:hypothetical protein n=1 Tax=Micromonospora sp. CPCC 205539 TaxID=3122408 RepID=UPI002FEE993E